MKIDSSRMFLFKVTEYLTVNKFLSVSFVFFLKINFELWALKELRHGILGDFGHAQNYI